MTLSETQQATTLQKAIQTALDSVMCILHFYLMHARFRKPKLQHLCYIFFFFFFFFEKLLYIQSYSLQINNEPKYGMYNIIARLTLSENRI